MFKIFKWAKVGETGQLAAAYLLADASIYR